MKKLIASLVVVLVVGSAGCSNGTTPAPDPFFGKVTISPPSMQRGAAASSYTPPVVAAPVTPSNQPWPSPAPANFGRSAPLSPQYGSAASTSQPTRPIYLSQAAIEDSVRQPSYSPNNNKPNIGAGSSQPTAAAGVNRATIYPAPNLQAVNGQPVRVENNIAYHSADGSIPQYGDPRSSFGQAPTTRFRNGSGSSVAPAWPSSGQANTSNSPAGTAPFDFGATQSPNQPSVTPGTLASSSNFEKTLPPIRGYASSNRTARAQTTQQSDSRLASSLSPAIRRPRSLPTFAPAGPDEPPILPVPSQSINIANLPDVSRIATRPSSGVRRLNYETPATGSSPRSDSTQPVPRGSQVRPVSFTPRILYSHEEDYSRLRGELEYSEDEERWKLRYISIGEEKSDNYGGSVILSETAKLSGFERGDFIEVRGRILSGPQGDWGYARSYEVTDIQRIK